MSVVAYVDEKRTRAGVKGRGYGGEEVTLKRGRIYSIHPTGHFFAIPIHLHPLTNYGLTGVFPCD